MEGAGKDGFFDEVDLLQYPFGYFPGLLLFGEEVVKDVDDFDLFIFAHYRNLMKIFYIK